MKKQEPPPVDPDRAFKRMQERYGSTKPVGLAEAKDAEGVVSLRTWIARRKVSHELLPEQHVLASEPPPKTIQADLLTLLRNLGTAYELVLLESLESAGRRLPPDGSAAIRAVRNALYVLKRKGHPIVHHGAGQWSYQKPAPDE